MSEAESRFVVYRELGNGYRWRVQTTTGETLAASSRGHRDKHTCYDEVRTVMAEQHPSADIQDVAHHGVRVASPPLCIHWSAWKVPCSVT